MKLLKTVIIFYQKMKLEKMSTKTWIGNYQICSPGTLTISWKARWNKSQYDNCQQILPKMFKPTVEIIIKFEFHWNEKVKRCFTVYKKPESRDVLWAYRKPVPHLKALEWIVFWWWNYQNRSSSLTNGV